MYLNKNINTPLLLFLTLILLIFPSLFLLLMNVIIHQQVHVSFNLLLIIVIVIHQNYFLLQTRLQHNRHSILTLMTWEVYAIILNSYVQKRITWWINHKLISEFMHSTKVELKISVWCLIANLNLFSMCFQLDALVMHKKVVSWGEFLLHSSRCDRFFLLKNFSFRFIICFEFKNFLWEVLISEFNEKWKFLISKFFGRLKYFNLHKNLNFKKF